MARGSRAEDAISRLEDDIAQLPAQTAKLSLDERPEAREHIFRSKLPDICIPYHMTLAEYCMEKALQWPDKVAIVDGNTGEALTYGELSVLSQRVAAGLMKLGVEKGGVIAVLLPNGCEFVAVFLGAAIRGAIVTTANPFYTPVELENQIRVAGATMVVTHSSYVEKLRALDLQVPTCALSFRDFFLKNAEFSNCH
jgi:4-coumarate--CoA ligase